MTELMTFEQLCELFSYTPKGRTLTTKEVAGVLCVYFQTVESWRVTGSGPRFFSPKGSRIVRYSERDLLAWMAAGEKRSTSQAA